MTEDNVIKSTGFRIPVTPGLYDFYTPIAVDTKVCEDDGGVSVIGTLLPTIYAGRGPIFFTPYTQWPDYNNLVAPRLTKLLQTWKRSKLHGRLWSRYRVWSSWVLDCPPIRRRRRVDDDDLYGDDEW